jgi:hypothetical protein
VKRILIDKTAEGGPVRVEMDELQAQDAVMNEPDRWVYENRPIIGPEPIPPGHFDDVPRVPPAGETDHATGPVGPMAGGATTLPGGTGATPIVPVDPDTGVPWPGEEAAADRDAENNQE